MLQQQVGEDEVEEAVVGGFQSQDDTVPGFVPQPGDPVLPPGLPTWEEAHTINIPTIKHIPKGAREEWARVLAKAINDVSSTPDSSQLWLMLYILPRCILPARPKSQGFQQVQSAAQVIKAACRKWREGKIVELWQEALQLKRKVGKEQLKKRKKKKKQAERVLGEERTQATRNKERATELVQEGQLSRAAKALVSRGVDLDSEAAKREMEEKHPQVQQAALPEGEPSAAALTLTSNQVFKAIWGFKAGTAPGPSGLRGEHLKEAKAVRTEGRGAATVGALTRFVNVLVKGKIPKEVSPFFFGANLFALVKKDGGFRPVAVGNTLRRLASKCVSYAVSGRASAYLRPLQFGVGVRGGCEAVVHATRATLEDGSIPMEEKWSLQVDLRNCFNQVDRGAMFQEVREQFPEIAWFVEAAYGQNSNLNFGDRTILSTTGTHQGCPLAPLLTALTIQPVAKKVQEVEGLRQNTWFLDDGELIGKKEALGKAWDILVEEGVPRGLHLNPDKSVVFCPDHDVLDLDPLGRGVKRAEGGGIKLLGAPIGEDGFVERVLRKRLTGVQALLGELHQLEDPHIELTLLRNCFALPKFSFALRTADTSRHPAILEEFDSSVKEAVEAILGSPLPPLQYNQAVLPISMGGLGLRQAKQHGSSAYLASVGDAAMMVQETRLQLQEQGEVQGLENEEGGLTRALAELNSHLEEPLSKEEACAMSQRALSGLIDKEAALRLLNGAVTERDKARLNCVARDGSGDWVTAPPSKALGLHLRKSEFFLAARYRLGLPIFQREGNCPMTNCQGFGDKYGDHSISCAINGERIAKHNHVRDAIFAAAAQAALGPRKEPAGLLPGSDDRPADVLLPFWANGKDAALDISIVNPMQQALVGQVAREGDSGVQHTFNVKVRKYSERCEAEGFIFVPMIVDTYGGWHKESLEVLTKLGRQVARQTGKEEENTVRQLRQRVAILLIRDNVAMFDSRSPSYPQSAIDGDVDIDV